MLKTLLFATACNLTIAGAVLAQGCPGTSLYDFTTPPSPTASATQLTSNFNILKNCLNNIYNSSGNIGIGTSAPQSPLSVSGAVVIGGPYYGDASLHILGTYGAWGRLTQLQTSGISQPALNLIASTDGSSNHQWFSWGVNNGAWTVNPGTTFGNTFTVDSNNRVSVATAPGGWFGASTFSVQSNSLWVGSFHATQGTGVLLLRSDLSGFSYFAYMQSGGSAVGSITTSGSSVNYNTTSDYRLKTNIVPLANPLDRVMRLRPVSYNWKVAPQNAMSDGFLAHEVAQVIPDAVTGQKDAVDKAGAIIPQQVDYSKLVPLLVAAVQAEQAEILALKAQISASKPGT